MRQLLLFTAFFLGIFNSNAQEIYPLTNNFSALRGQTSVEVLVDFEGMSVDQFENEQDFLVAMKQRWEKKDKGAGETWVNSWMEKKILTLDRRYKDLFYKYSGFDRNEQDEYIITFKTVKIETGFDGPLGKYYAFVSGRLVLTKRTDPKVIMAISNTIRMKGEAVIADATGSVRIGDAYARSGRVFGKYIKEIRKRG